MKMSVNLYFTSFYLLPRFMRCLFLFFLVICCLSVCLFYFGLFLFLALFGFFRISFFVFLSKVFHFVVAAAAVVYGCCLILPRFDSLIHGFIYFLGYLFSVGWLDYFFLRMELLCFGFIIKLRRFFIVGYLLNYFNFGLHLLQ